MTRHGGLDALELQQVETPRPRPGVALVKVHATAVNRLDLWVRQDEGHAYSAKIPLIPGYDVAGEVAELGEDGKGPASGTPVYVHYDYSCGRCEWCLAGEESLCSEYAIMGVNHDGGYAEYVVAPVRNLFPLDERVGFEAAAAAGSVYLTAYHIIFARGGLRAGESVLVMAAGSGVGTAALQFARWAGASTFATAGSDDKRRRALDAGAIHAVDYTQDGWSEEVRRATGGRGIDLVVDHTGSQLFEEAVRTLAPRGRIVVCGASSGPFAQLDLVDLFARQISVIGSSDGSRRELLEVFRLLAEGVVSPVIDEILPLERAPEAQELLERRLHFGRILLSPLLTKPP
jgi:2-desacetyl-2-hydroxyethyl bacteriochlorophyllide A dehydrogenase